MESQTPTRRWGEILIPLVILTSICVPGMEAMDCGGTTCGHGTSCVNGACYCKRGYTRFRQKNNVEFCSERCGTAWGVCPVNTACEDTFLGHVCLCSAGAQRSAKGQCLDIDECANKPKRCGNNSVCENTVGKYRCVCAEGYRQREGERVGCNLDIDECTDNPGICGNNSICANTVGNYTCTCAEGYRQKEGEEVGCSLDIDECNENQTICGNNSVCVNTEGNYTCACVECYRPKEGEELGCNLDIDECTEDQTICGNNSVCANTVGNYTCACVVGYRKREGEEVGCSLVVTAAAPSTAADSSALTIGLAVGIGGVILLAVVVLAVVVFRRNMSSTNPTTSHNTDHSYQNVIGLAVPDKTRRSYGTDYGAVPEPGVSAANQGPGSTADVSTRSTVSPYENIREETPARPSNLSSGIYTSASTPEVSETLYTTLTQPELSVADQGPGSASNISTRNCVAPYENISK